ncbi:right-handed parallel beta-helix repeat-containing protein [Actinoallomurus rhizosphaericola]|uniref:right-handed parallel beta-helix repeat-containing protein n=1 Tax=Actinoallomurus rhizosphaericola TaxID=2952536 RepID=UPI00208FFD2A|nr:right-handed parallel beta-helix repeat-containing protein [Actinoallomurus rhizosphaericola]MCO5994317.1 right-handed parallel beta-helix repeat-containing protein [Actinoallomurus rhizosphaericola]
MSGPDSSAGSGRPGTFFPWADPFVYNAREHGLAGDGVTNDQPALQALVDTLGAACADDGQPRTIYCPSGRYSIRDSATAWRSGISLIGAGRSATRFLLANPGDRTVCTPLAWFTIEQHGASPSRHIADCTFACFEIDGSGVELEEYDPYSKGLGLQYVLRGIFRDLYIHDVASTGFGCDFLQDTLVENVLTVHCGRLDPGESMGGAGIGIGVGGWGSIERCTISACTAVDNGTNGIFVELQDADWAPTRGIRVVGCHTEGNRFGISDWGADGLVVSGCTMLANLQAGYDVSALGPSGVAGRGGVVTGCIIEDNVTDGVAVGNTPGPYTFAANRISRNGRYGYWQHNLDSGRQAVAADVIIDGNEFWGNGLDGITVDSPLTDPTVTNNRFRNNGRRCEHEYDDAGESVSYTPLSVVDIAADWRPNGHKGKCVTAADQEALVVGNSRTELKLAPRRPGSPTAWSDGPPPSGARYRLPGAPEVRAGIRLAAGTDSATICGNRAWDSQPDKTQTHGLVITDSGDCHAGFVHDNDLLGNAEGTSRFDTVPSEGCWYQNPGLDDSGRPGSLPTPEKGSRDESPDP